MKLDGVTKLLGSGADFGQKEASCVYSPSATLWALPELIKAC